MKTLIRTLGALILMGCCAWVVAQETLREIPVAPARPMPPLLRVPEATQPVRLTAMRVESRVVGRLARTTVELTFKNPNARVLEGDLQFPLLPGQEVTGFALDIHGMWRDAVPVEKAKGRQVFDDVTRTRIDPALLESTQGNHFKLRVYPIPAEGERRVSLTLTERLPAEKDGYATLRLALPVEEKLSAFSVRLAAPGLTPAQAKAVQGLPALWEPDEEGVRLVFERVDFQPEKMIEVRFAQSAKPVAVVEQREGNAYFYAELAAPDFARRLRPRPARLALVWDASGSGAARDHGREFALLDAYFKAIGQTEVSLSLARDLPEAAGVFKIRGGNWSALRAALERVAYDGATAAHSFLPAGRADAILLFSDGLVNYGGLPMPAFSAPLLAVNAAGVADGVRLAQAARDSGGAFVDLARTPPEQAAQALREMSPRLLSIRSNRASDLVASTRDADGRLAVAGILTGPEAAVTLEWAAPSGARQKQNFKLVRNRAVAGFAAQSWARLKIDAMAGEYALNQAEISRLGKQFSLVTRATSLIILDRVEDYVRHDIVPPSGLRAEFDRLRAVEGQRLAREKTDQFEEVVRRFQEKIQWWEKDFPKDEPPKKAPEKYAGPRPAPAAALAPGNELMMRASPAEDEMPGGPMPRKAGSPGPAGAPAGTASIQLKKWAPDAPYFRRLREAPQASLYRVYLDERPGYANSTAFFLDAAEIFFERGEKQLALRILSNLAEMELENRHILRILSYRLLQAKRPDLALHMLARVLDLAPDEPQSWRDLGLAQAAAGKHQQAVEALYEVVRRPWHGRFPDVELIALAEMNDIIATAPSRLDTSAIDPRLLRNLPLDLRVVLSWDADNTDIDLWVTDPNGEKVFYAHPLSYQGGRISRDFTGGYGPEEFSLKTAKPGKYLVQAQFYGHRQQIVAGATTLQLVLSTGFGTPQEKQQTTLLRLKGQQEVVTVGEFQVRSPGEGAQ